MSPEVSIIIPLYNRQTLVAETLLSIQRQTFTNFECIVVDDGSTDDSLAVAKQTVANDSRFRFFERPGSLTKGGNSCRNFGFSLSTAPFINFFDSDDLMHEHMLSEKMKLMKSGDADMIICRLLFFEKSIADAWDDARTSLQPLTDNPPFEFFGGTYWFGTCQPLIRRSFLEQFSLFPSHLKRHQETELFVRVLLKKPVIEYLEQYLIYVRLHPQSIRGNYESADEATKLLLDFHAYREILRSFSGSSYYTTEVRNYFKDFFYRCLRRMKLQFPEYSQCLKICLQHNFGPSRLKILRLFTARSFQGLRSANSF